MKSSSNSINSNNHPLQSNSTLTNSNSTNSNSTTYYNRSNSPSLIYSNLSTTNSPIASTSNLNLPLTYSPDLNLSNNNNNNNNNGNLTRRITNLNLNESTSSSASSSSTYLKGNHKKTNSNSSDVDLDITRPSLRRVTGSNSTITTKSATKFTVERGSKARRSFDELSSPNTQADREVVIHELIKTDSIASISLAYGITPQALRHSNRLWPSDSIHLRKTLNIPLDQCHLPSSSTIERISREEDGNLVVWEREKLPVTSSLNNNLGLRGIIESRRAASASALDLSSGSSGRSSYDLLGGGAGQVGTEDSNQYHRSSLDSFRDLQDLKMNSNPNDSIKGKAPALLIDGEDFEDAVSGYLSSTNNPYSFNSAPPSPPPPTNSIPYNYNNSFEQHQLRLSTPPLNRSNLINSTLPDSPDVFNLNGNDNNNNHSRSQSPNNYSDSNFSNSSLPYQVSPSQIHSDSSNNLGSLSKRTLLVSKVPSSTLSFFPPPNPSFASTSTTSLSSSTNSNHNNLTSSYNNGEHKNSEEYYKDRPAILLNKNNGIGTGVKKVKKKKSLIDFNRTITTSLGLLNLSPSPSSSSHSTISSKNKLGGGSNTKKGWLDGFNLTYFGGEEGDEVESLSNSRTKVAEPELEWGRNFNNSSGKGR